MSSCSRKQFSESKLIRPLSNKLGRRQITVPLQLHLDIGESFVQKDYSVLTWTVTKNSLYFNVNCLNLLLILFDKSFILQFVICGCFIFAPPYNNFQCFYLIENFQLNISRVFCWIYCKHHRLYTSNSCKVLLPV